MDIERERERWVAVVLVAQKICSCARVWQARGGISQVLGYVVGALFITAKALLSTVGAFLTRVKALFTVQSRPQDIRAR